MAKWEEIRCNDSPLSPDLDLNEEAKSSTYDNLAQSDVTASCSWARGGRLALANDNHRMWMDGMNEEEKFIWRVHLAHVTF